MRRGDGLVLDSVRLAAAIGVTTATRFVYHMLVSRRLGAPDYGVLVALLGLLVLLTLPVNALQLALAHFTAAQDPAGAKRLFRSASLAFFVVGLAVFGLIAAVSGPLGEFLRIEDRFLLLLLASMGVWNLLLGALRGHLQGNQRFGRVGWILVLDGVLKVVAAAGLMAMLRPLRGAMAANLVAAALAWGIGLTLTLRGSGGGRAAPPGPILHESLGPVFRYSLPVFLALLGFSVLGYLDIFMVRHLFEDHAAGLYAAAAQVGKTFLFIPDAIALTLFSKTSENYLHSRASRRLLFKAGGLACGLLLPGLLACHLAPEWIVRVLFGPEFLDVSGLLGLFALAMIPFVFLSVVIHYSLAQRRYLILVPLYAGAVGYAALLLRFHRSMEQVLLVQFWANTAILLVALATTWWSGRAQKARAAA
jgi:O-antigen/teichoic acid export membrane protein